MSELGRPFLHPDVRRLIEDDRLAPDPPDAVKRQVARRLDRSLELGGAMLAAIPAAGLPPPPLPDAPSPSLPPPPPASLFGWKLVAGAALSAVVGGVAVLSLAVRMPQPVAARSGESVHVAQEAPSVHAPAGGAAALFADVDSPAPVTRRGISVDPTPPAAAVPRRSRTAPAQAATRGALRRAASSRASSSVDTLAAERTVLDGARAALVRRDGPAALSALRSHEQAFAHGQLLEERESMRVQALGLVRDVDGARAAADRFRRHFPHSMFLPAVEQAVEAAP